jgi:chemotaxis protein histidine kinase CheA
MLRLFAGDLERRADRVERYLGELAGTPEPERRDALVDALSLEAHNLTGTARTLGLTEVEQVAAGFEALVARIGRGDTAVAGRDAATVAGALRSVAASCTDDAGATARTTDSDPAPPA